MRLQLIKVFENQFSSKIQVASRELRMPLLNVHLRGTSTETVPNTNVSGGSVVADLNGLAVKVNPIAVALNSLISSGPNPWVELRCETSCISHLLLQFWV
jgi:aldehyde oxidase